MSRSQSQSHEVAQTYEEVALLAQEVETAINNLKQWGVAEEIILEIVREIIKEFHQAKELDARPDEATMEGARQTSSTLAHWIQETDQNKYTKTRNQHLVRCYDAAMENWCKIGGSALKIPYIAMGEIKEAQKAISKAYGDSSRAIEQFEAKLNKINASIAHGISGNPSAERVDKLQSDLRTLRLGIGIEKNSISHRLKRSEGVIKGAFRDLRPKPKHDSKHKK